MLPLWDANDEGYVKKEVKFDFQITSAGGNGYQSLAVEIGRASNQEVCPSYNKIIYCKNV